MLKRPVLILALIPAATAAAPWQLAPETTVAVDVAWGGPRRALRFPTLSGQIDFDPDRPGVAPKRASAVVSATQAPPPACRWSTRLLRRAASYLASRPHGPAMQLPPRHG